MKFYKILLFFAILSVFSFQTCLAQNVTTLKGKVIDRPNSKNLLLVKAFDDVRFDKIASIPIVEGKFEYTLNSDEILAYELIFEEEFYNGSMKPITFFSENTSLTIKLNDFELFENNEIIGGKVNENYQNFQNRVFDDFYEKVKVIRDEYKNIPHDKMLSDAYNDVRRKLKNAKTQEERVPLYKEMEDLREKGLDKSELGKEREAKGKVLFDEFTNLKYKYINNKLDIVSFYMLMDDLMGIEYNNSDEVLITKSFKKLSKKFPNHSYTKLGASLLHALKDLKPGGQYVNFIAPDINGNEFELKSILKENKVVLLDLWATWCGPCIAKTRLVKPVYEKYKNKGFTILGVAGEFKDLDAFKKRINTEKWEWQQLIELDKENKIWEKYNIMNSGGGMFLIAGSGEILAVDPSAEQVEAILKDRL